MKFYDKFMSKHFSIYLSLILVFILIACNTKNRFKIDISKIPAEEVEIKRYEKAIFAIPADSFIQNIGEYQSEFPVFLEGNMADTNALLSLKSFFIDPNMIELNNLVSNQLGSLSNIESNFSESFRHFRYYFPQLPSPQLYSYVSGLDFKFPVKFIQGSLLIGLDMYLGPKTKAYQVSGFPQYRNNWSVPEAIVPDVMNELCAGLLPPISSSANLLEQIVHYGKRLYFVKSMIPDLPDSLLYKYTAEQLNWAENNEGNIWGYLIENQSLFSTDKRIIRKFTDDGPFTDIFNKKSPPRLAYFIGFKMVEQFMIESDYSLPELLSEDNAMKIMKLSHYKPKI
jgi:hypothetical protein